MKIPRDLQVLTVAQIIHLHHTLRGDCVPFAEHVPCCETSRAIIEEFGVDATRAALKSYKRQDYTYGLYSYQSDEARAAQAQAMNGDSLRSGDGWTGDPIFTRKDA